MLQSIEQPARWVIALDIATKTGVAYGRPFTENGPGFSTWTLTGSPAERSFSLAERLTPLIDRFAKTGPGAIFCETPLDPYVATRIGTTAETVYLLNGLCLVAEFIAFSRGLPIKFVGRQEALSHFTGRSKFPDKNAGKHACMRRAELLGWGVEGLDEADAAAIWDLGVAKTNPRLFTQHAMQRPHLGGR